MYSITPSCKQKKLYILYIQKPYNIYIEFISLAKAFVNKSLERIWKNHKGTIEITSGENTKRHSTLFVLLDFLTVGKTNPLFG